MSAQGESRRPQLSPDGDFYWNGSTWVSLISADGTQRWDGKAWAPRTDLSIDEAPAAAATSSSSKLDLNNLPSWLPAEAAQVVLGGVNSLAAPVASQPAVAAPSAQAVQPQPPSRGSSTWVQQTYQAGGGSTAKPSSNLLLIGGAALLVLVIAVGGVFVYQQQAAGVSAPTPDAAHLPAAALLSAAKSSIGSAGSYHLLASAGAATQEITVSGPKDASIDIKSPAGTVSMVLTGGLQFLKAPAAFYADKNPVLAQNAADKWIMVPKDESLIPLTSVVDLTKTANCLVGRHGTLKKVGLTTMDGAPVVEVDDRGEVASGTPAHLYFTRDSGRLVGIDVVGASTPGGADPTCNGGLGIYSATFSAVQKYRFDHWGSAPDVRMPGDSIDLSQKPWCGAIVGSGLNAAVQQYLLAANTFSQKVLAIDAGGCGCQFSNWPIFSQAAMAEINASDEFSRSLDAIAFQGQAKADAIALVGAFRSRNAIMRTGLATGTFTGFHSADAQRAIYEVAIGGGVASLRADIGLLPNAASCDVALP